MGKGGRGIARGKIDRRRGRDREKGRGRAGRGSERGGRKREHCKICKNGPRKHNESAIAL